MAPPGPGGAPGYGGASGGGGGAGAAGAPPMGRYGTLRVVSGNDQGKVLELNRPVTTIGRGADQMLVVADIAVSRRHLQIHMTQTGYRLQDMGSPNGTMVNGKRVSEVQLMDGDQVEVGNSLLRFEHPPSRPQPEAPPAPPPMMAPPPAYAPMQPPMQPMGYPPQPQGYPPQPQGYMQPGMPMQQPMGYPPPPSVVQPVPPQMMAPPPMAMQSQAQPSMLMEPSAIAMAPMGGLSQLAIPQRRNMYFGAVGAALLVGLIGLTVSLVRGGNPQKAIDKATEFYVNGTKDFTANHYDTARKAFESALALAPESAELKHYIEACDTEEKAHKLIESAKKELEDRKYGEALKTFGKIDKGSIQYEDAQQQARLAKREAVKELVNQATAMAKNDTAGALEKVNKGLEELDPDSSELAELKSKLSNAPTKPAEEPTTVAENNPPPEKVKDPEPPKKEKKPPEPKKEPPKKEVKVAAKPEASPPAAGGGDLASNKQAASAYKSRDFAGAISAMKAIKNPKAQATVKDLEDIKAKTDQAAKDEGSKAASALSAYQAAAAIDKRLGGGLASFYSGKISALQSKAGGSPGSKPAAGGDAAKDAQADQLLGQAKGMVTKNPTAARNICRRVMQLYGNSPKNPKVQEAYRLLNSIKGGKDDDDDF